MNRVKAAGFTSGQLIRDKRSCRMALNALSYFSIDDI